MATEAPVQPPPVQRAASLDKRKPALPWSTALRVAARELMFAKVKFVFVVLSVAIGVGALNGVRGFADSF